MTVTEFVSERLKNMQKFPGMWAITKEGFILQVLVLVEAYRIDQGKGLDSHSAVRELAGIHVRPSELKEQISDTWAEDVIDRARLMIGSREHA